MKKYITCLILVLTIHHADAVTLPEIGGGGTLDPIGNACSNPAHFQTCVGTDITYYGCSTTACTECEGDGVLSGSTTTATNSYGIKITRTNEYVTTCPSAVYGGNATCKCETSTSYTCDTGYYGTATSETSGCTACPQNATCAGGNASTFSCNKNYYKSGTTCAACPSSGLTASAGATDVTACYITTFSDSTGSGKYTSNCYYTK